MYSTIRDIWRYADAAYDRPGTPPACCAGDTIYHTFSTDTDFCFIACENDRTVVSFKGTGSREESMPVVMRTWALNLIAGDWSSGNNLQKGIADGFEIFVAKYFESIKKLLLDPYVCDKPLFITGHSRGAAEALVLAYFLNRFSKRKVFSVIGFGCPNMMDKKRRNELNLAPIDITIVSTAYDIVSAIPPFRKKPGKLVRLPGSFFFPIPAFFKITRGIRDHLPETYEKALSKAARQNP